MPDRVKTLAPSQRRKPTRLISDCEAGLEWICELFDHPNVPHEQYYYGWCASNSRTTRDTVRWLVCLCLEFPLRSYRLDLLARQRHRTAAPVRKAAGTPLQPLRGDLELLGVIDNTGRVLYRRRLRNHTTADLDSG